MKADDTLEDAVTEHMTEHMLVTLEQIVLECLDESARQAAEAGAKEAYVAARQTGSTPNSSRIIAHAHWRRVIVHRLMSNVRRAAERGEVRR